MRLRINGFVLKLIAIIAMTVDHTAVLFFKNSGNVYLLMRSIGAITFPVMAYMICEGYRKTKNLRKYKLRLFVFSLVSMLPYAFAFGKDTYGLNVGFTLLSGLYAIECYDKIKNTYLKWVCILLISLVSTEFDWGFVGVWMIVAFYISNSDRKKIAWTMIMTIMLFIVKNQVSVFLSYGRFLSASMILNSYAFLRHIGFLPAVAAIFMYNGTKGVCIKHLFYVYYPLHLIVLALILRLA